MPTDLLAGLFWLLLPVAAASGWLAARKKYSQAQNKSPQHHVSPEYFRGVRYILNEQPDKAIEVFVKMLEVDNDTVDVHLALGNLFRRRGEVDRALQIHQNLIARPSLNQEQRSQALLELGIDYMRSGLLDRAEVLFNDLVNTGELKNKAANYLVEIYQDEKDWLKAIEFARKIDSAFDQKIKSRIAHFYCEQAEENRDRKEFSSARESIKLALKEDKTSSRASILEGQLAQEKGEHKKAISAFKRVGKYSPDLSAEVLPALKNSYEALGKDLDFLKYLEHLNEQQEGITQLIALSEFKLENEGLDKAAGYLVENLDKYPSIRIIDQVLNLALSKGSSQENEKLICLKKLTSKLVEKKTTYHCHQCGYRARTLHWNCPGCKHWDTIKPIEGIVSE